MPDPLKYAIVERERRYLVAAIPDGVTTVRTIIDRYLPGTRLRLREVIEADGTITHKLGHTSGSAKAPPKWRARASTSMTQSGLSLQHSRPGHSGSEGTR